MVLTNPNGSVTLSKNEYLIAGSISGFVSRAIVQPLDVLKIRFQLQVEPISVSSTSKYHGFVQAIRCISKEEGAVAFWKGHVPAQMQAVTYSAIQFLAFEVLVAWFSQMNMYVKPSNFGGVRPSNTVQNFVCGSIAGSVAAAFTQPLDVLRTRFIAQGEPKLYKNISHAALHIASHEGLPGFFRGLVPSVLLIAPQTGLQFAIYHTFNRVVESVRLSWKTTANESSVPSLSTNQPQGNVHLSVGPIQSLVSGGLAGMGSKCVIYPLDMMKKRMQIHGFEEARTRFGRVQASASLRDCLSTIWNKEGATALFKGLRPTLLKSCVSISCRFTAYEQICRFIYSIRHSDKSGRNY